MRAYFDTTHPLLATKKYATLSPLKSFTLSSLTSYLSGELAPSLASQIQKDYLYISMNIEVLNVANVANEAKNLSTVPSTRRTPDLLGAPINDTLKADAVLHIPHIANVPTDHYLLDLICSVR